MVSTCTCRPRKGKQADGKGGSTLFISVSLVLGISHLSLSPKKDLRHLAILRRGEAALQIGNDAPQAVSRHFLDHIPWKSTDVASSYWPIGSEIDAIPLLKLLSERGLVTALPAIIRKETPLQFRQWQPRDALETGPFQISQPPASAQIVVPTILIVPLLSFDAKGNRLGYGGGYYDRTLAALRSEGQVLAVGIAFSQQQMPDLPNSPHDQLLDWVVTEQMAIRCRI